jgi:dihydrofolate reductase
MGHAMIMGRRTWASIGRALPGRTSVVLSSQRLPLTDGVLAARDLDEELRLARAVDPEPIVIGGGAVYAAAMPRTTRILLTAIDQDVPDGDAFFPPVGAGFREVSRRAGVTPGVTFVELRRQGAEHASAGAVGAPGE